jgi:cytochrome c oxidase assembly protein subunit 15
VIAGGLVTSNDAAGSIPDWPLSWGRLVPVLEGGIRYEFSHRVGALVVTILTGAVAWRIRSRLAWIALGTILLQVAIGGVLVRFLDPKAAAIAHAALAQLFFGMTVMLCAERRMQLRPRGLRFSLPTIAAIAIFAQTILGAAVRHGVIGPISHLAGAMAAVGLVMWAALPVLITHMDDVSVRRPAMILLSITFSQVLLGGGAWMSRLANLNAPQPLPLMVLFTVAHVAVGSLAFGSAIVLAIALPDLSGIHREGMAAA